MNTPLLFKTKFKFRIKRIEANTVKTAFFLFESAKAVLLPAHKIRILFSAGYGHEKGIRRGFFFLKHKIDFDTFTPENISKYDLVIPLNIEDVKILSRSPGLIKNNLIKIPDERTVEICDNKILFNQTLIGKGFQDYVPKIGDNLPLPFLVKKKATWGGDHCFLVPDQEKKNQLAGLINDPDYFCQEVIEGIHEYATHILFRNGKIIRTLTFRYTFYNETSINGKEGFICSDLVKCPYLDIFAAILQAIDYEGLCCFDYKVANGKPKIFEINPRFGGSLSAYFFSFLNSLETAA